MIRSIKGPLSIGSLLFFEFLIICFIFLIELRMNKTFLFEYVKSSKKFNKC
jgi:hypothetical protein